jgi:hypothetical protein
VGEPGRRKVGEEAQKGAEREIRRRKKKGNPAISERRVGKRVERG